MINTIPHYRYTRDGDNLLMEYKITLLQALVGFSVKFKHLDGHEVEISRDIVTSPGTQITIEGEGMPIHGAYDDEHGDLIITFSVRFPTSLTNDQKNGFKKLLEN